MPDAMTALAWLISALTVLTLTANVLIVAHFVRRNNRGDYK